jgi:intraflagellar transport protein 74
LFPALLYRRSESHRLQQDLEKVQQLEGKITGELGTLKEKIVSMKAELVTFGDLDTLKNTAESRKKVRVMVMVS